MEKIKWEGVGSDDGLTLSALIHHLEILSGLMGGKCWVMRHLWAETQLSEAKAGPATL